MAYATSELYKEAIQKASKTTRITGKLTTQNGVVIDIDNDKIDTGSFYITNQCVNKDAFEYGSVFAAEMGITLKTDVDRYSLYDAKVQLDFGILLSNDEYETIPLGVFNINEPTRVGKSITIKAYDDMLKLDKDLEESTDGTPWDFLLLTSQRCGVELAQTEEEILAFTNGDKLLSLNMDRVQTYRDLISYLGVVLCSFAIIDRQGKLRLCKFRGDKSKVIDAKIRTSSRFSDFESYHTSMKGFFLESGVFQPYFAIDEVDDGLLFDIGENPLVQGLPDDNQVIFDNIFEEVKKIKYVPSEISFSGDPSIELGDEITCIDRQGNEITILATFYKWQYRGSHTIKSAGINPKLSSVKEKKNNDLAKMEADIKAKLVAVYSYTNARNLRIKGGTEPRDYLEVVRIAFAVENDVTALFMAMIPFHMDCDGYVEFTGYVDGVYYENSTVTKYCSKGDNVVTLVNYLPVKKGATYKYSVMARTYYEKTQIRENEASIATNNNARDAIISSYESLVLSLKEQTVLPFVDLNETIVYDIEEIDMTIPTMTIEKLAVKSAIFGQGLAGQVDWDGTITMFEMVSKIPLNTEFNSKSPVEKLVGIGKHTPSISSFNASIPTFSLSSVLNMRGVVETPNIGRVILGYSLNTAKANRYDIDDGIEVSSEGYKLKTEFEYQSEEISIDSGKACVLILDTSALTDVQSIEVEVI